MRRRPLVAALAAAGLLALALGVSSHRARSSRPSARPPTGAASSTLSGPSLAAAAGAAPAPVHDDRVEQFLRDQPLAAELRHQLVELAQLQRVTYAPRPSNQVETMAERAERRARREDFRVRVRELVAALPPSARVAMRDRHVNLVRLAQAVEAGSVTP